MNFLDYVAINPKVSLEKGKIYPFVEMCNVSTCFRNPNNIEYKCFSSGVKFEKGDTVIARITPCLQNGKKFYCKDIEKGFGSTEYLVFRPKDSRCDSLYLYYFMNLPFIKESMIKSMTGATGRQRVNNDIFSKLEIQLPDITTQRHIGSTLSTYDDLIENNQKQIKLLEEAAQRLYKEWFIDLRFPGWENTPIVDGVPDGWRLKPMDDIADYINGYAFKPSDWGTVGKPIIKIREMGLGVTADTPRNTGKNIPEKYNITAGDILFSWSATLSAMIWDEEDGLLNQHLFKVIPYDGVSREFVLQSILKTLDEFSNLTTGSTMKHIQRGKLKEVHVIVPPENIMHNYELISEPIREQLLSLKQQIILLQESRDRLLPKLMNGELEIQMN